MNIGIATDHRGVKQKEKLIKYLEKKGHTIYNYGTDSEDSVDYPDYAFKIGEKINEGEIEIGILICGTGVGMCIASNKVKNIRCAKVDNLLEAKLSRSHNNANVITLSSYMSLMRMKDILDVFLKTSFSGDERHVRRLTKIDEYLNEY